MQTWLGWLATGVFTLSYLCRDAATLRRVQAGGALLWIGYGVMIGAPPVIVANLLVAAVAIGSAWAGRSVRRRVAGS